MLKISGLMKTIGAKTIFQEAFFDIPDGTKTVLVGPNGSGKSTLLRIIAGVDKDYIGEITWSRKTPLIGYIQQELYIDDKVSIVEYLKSESGITPRETRLHELYNQFSRTPLSTEITEQIGTLQQELEYMDYYRIDSKIETILFGLGFEKSHFNQNISTLSGGQKRRVLLALMLLKGIDLLLLDEPTNDLDYYAINWLTNYLHDLKDTTIIVVSHNKKFLNKVAKKVLEIDIHLKSIVTYSGSFDEYKKLKEEHLSLKELEFSQQEKLKKVIEKNITTAQQKATRDTVKIHDNDKLSRNKAKDSGQKTQGKIIKSLSSRIERLTMEEPYRKKPLLFTLSAGEAYKGDIIISDLEYSYQDTGFSLKIKHLAIQSNEKVVIIGKNGSGKTTMINLLLGNIKPDKGMVQLPSGVKVGYLGQSIISDTDKALSVISYFSKYTQIGLLDEEIITLLNQFELYQESENVVKNLSPGQKIRLQLAIFYTNKNNLLILDEPTNHLDIEAIEVLEQALNEYNGTFLLISHDEDFIHKISPDKVLQINNGEVKQLKSTNNLFKA